MFCHLFELCSRTTIIGIRINGNTTTRSKYSRYFYVFGIHQSDKIFHYDVHTIFMKGTMTAETEKIQFQTFAFYHFYIRNVADTYFSKIRLPCDRTQTCELRAVKTYPIVIFRMLIIKSFQYFRSIILLILGLSFLIKKVRLLILSLYSLTTIPILDKKTHFLFHLSPASLKRSIHRCFSGERFVLQPITASITYHHQPLTHSCFIRSLLVTVCFIT